MSFCFGEFERDRVRRQLLRSDVGDDARHPRFIRTVHGFGYAFCGTARAAAEELSG